MARGRWPEGFEPDVEPEPWQKLAAAVIHLAVLDTHSQSPNIRRHARNWLELADDGLSFWCEIAGLQVPDIRVRVAREIERQRERPAGMVLEVTDGAPDSR
jgi:hypothetical protein